MYHLSEKHSTLGLVFTCSVLVFFSQIANYECEYRGSATVKLVNGVHLLQYFGRSVVTSYISSVILWLLSLDSEIDGKERM